MFKKLSEFFMIVASLCGLIAVIIATGIIALSDKYFIIIIAPLCGIIAVAFTISFIYAFDKYLLSFCFGKLATTIKAASKHKILQPVLSYQGEREAAPVTIKIPSVKSWAPAKEAA